MNKKKVVACLLAATMTAGMLAGCGGSSGSSDSSSSSGGKDKLTFWFPTFASADGEVTDEEFWNEKMDAFEEENNCEVNVEIIPWDNYEEKYLTGVNSNDGPDVGYLYMEMFYDYIDMGALADIDEYFTDDEKANYLYYDLGNIQGGQYALPVVVGNPRVLAANMDILKDAGIDSVPTNWDELKAACEALKAYDDSIYPWGIDMTTDEGQAAFAYYTWNNGGGFVDDEGNWTLNSEQNVEAIQYAIDLVNSGYTNTDPANDTRYDLQDMFGAGKVAMLIAPNSLPTYIATGGNEVNYGVASIPSNTGESVSAGVMDRFMCFDNDYSDDEKAAISTFFDYFYDDARYTEWVDMEGFLPATKSGGEALAAANEDMASWIDILDSCKFYPTAKAEWADVKQGVINVEQNALLGGDVQELLDDLQAEIAG